MEAPIMKIKSISAIIVSLLLLFSLSSLNGCNRTSDTEVKKPSSIKLISSITIQADAPDVLLAGESLQFAAKTGYSDGTGEDATSRVMWLISDAKNVSISKGGLLTVIGEGPPPGGSQVKEATDEGDVPDEEDQVGYNPYKDEISGVTPPSEKSMEVYVMASLGGIKSEVTAIAINTAWGASEYLLESGTEGLAAKNISLSAADWSAVKVAGKGVLNLSRCVIVTTGDASSAINSSVFGLNAAVLSRAGGRMGLSNVTVSTGGKGATGVFSTGKGTTINASDLRIKTTGYGSHCLSAAMEGVITARDINISTTGDRGAAIDAGTGGGVITAAHATGRTSSATGSPCVYVGDGGLVSLSVSDMTAENSEGAVITGTGALTLETTDLKGATCGIKAWGIDQSTDQGRASISGGSITAVSGDAIIVTGANLDILVEGRASINHGEGYKLLRVTDEGSANLTARGVVLQGDLAAEDDSLLTVSLNNSATLTGTITNAALIIDPTSQWIVKGDSTLTTLDLDGIAKIRKNIKDNGYAIYYDAEAGANSWLRGKTYELDGGGSLTPESGARHDVPDNKGLQ
jgi:hypothetical protein